MKNQAARVLLQPGYAFDKSKQECFDKMDMIQADKDMVEYQGEHQPHTYVVYDSCRRIFYKLMENQKYTKTTR